MSLPPGHTGPEAGDNGAADSAALTPEEHALAAHRLCLGKVQVVPKCPTDRFEQLALWYTPGVAAACRAIVRDADSVDTLTNRANTIAIVSDGSRILGLGDIGPAAGLPVMEGKALLFKVFGGVDAVPLCIDAHDTDEIVAVVKALAPSFAAINLEDIAAPKCFRVLDILRRELPIPVWHDDQQGTATVVLAGLHNALAIVGKRLEKVRIALIGIGAANMAVYRLLKSEGAAPSHIVACDSRGILHPGRADIAAAAAKLPEKWEVCRETNAAHKAGGIREALAGADVCIAFSQPGPGTIAAPDIAGMAKDAIVFACANPVPEIDPKCAKAAGARIVATGRSDYPNQVNNALAFPAIFRGLLDSGASSITDGMVRAAAEAMASAAREKGLRDDAILPRVDDIDVIAHIAAATALAAQADGVASREASRNALVDGALARIRRARSTAQALCDAGAIPTSEDIARLSRPA